ncbi:GINS complex subunit [Oleoguttula sp. CCFEE 5521]
MDTDISDILASVSSPTTHANTLDLQALTRAWVNERSAPELLPYPADLIARVSGRLSAQILKIESLTSTNNPGLKSTLVIYQTELERVKFLLRSYLRARLAKIDAYPHHSLALPSSHLSPLETQYTTHHQSLLSTHYHTSFLSAFPASLQRLDDTTGGVSMVDRPDEDTAVFCRVLRDCGGVDVQGAEGTAQVELRRGDIWVLRWRDVRGRVEEGSVEMI